ncbi:exodeoxyribonuclease V subunit alpha [Syntrophorhabdus aromaticivorans]|uniref:exodeoxyribonuclease V subunit alpha n=1 Tax=Syntrophorhabdus aromaticivorans TaxID=328301 RepID=UPI000405017C|nr:exodeoxyribonuclease V subunit alpha [Syntrophorhabdus aromaticivorans]
MTGGPIATPDIGTLEKLFGALDRHFADFMVKLSQGLSPRGQVNLWLAAALVSNSVGKGDVCLLLSEKAGRPLVVEDEADGDIPSIRYPDLEEWVNDLREGPVVGKPGDFRPLILDEKYRLYLYRYWLYEQDLARFIIAGMDRCTDAVDTAVLADSLRRLFPGGNGDETDWQGVAAIVTAYRKLSIISGGPGTGKTYTVARILALLIEQARAGRIAIALAAPTGKAAARLAGMIREAKDTLDCTPQVKTAIPQEASTIHRLLGPTSKAGTFRFNKTNRLPYDVVVVDEASMVDLPLMAKLVSALSDHGRLILLGDKDQLASVEPGAVFGDICGTGRIVPPLQGLTKMVEEMGVHRPPREGVLTGVLPDFVTVLQKSYRFSADAGIGNLAAAVNRGDSDTVFALLKERTCPDVLWQETPPPERVERALEERLGHVCRDYFATENPEEIFYLFGKFHLLCALRQGPYGAVAVNRLIESIARRNGFIRPEGRWYKGQPVMVTSNDYQLRLFNGDIGILLPDPETGGQLRVYFPTEKGAFRKLLPGRLSEWETAFAMTVHKSQGSEFEHVMVLLPDRSSEVLTRELIYTAITRAKKTVELWGREDVLAEALGRRTRRQSGLRDALSQFR